MPPLPLSASVGRIAIQALDRKSAQLGALLAHWEAIAGPRIGGISFPVKVSRARKTDEAAILTLALPSAWMTELQHESPLLLKRINAFFGHRAVREIRLVSRSAPPRAAPSRPRALSKSEEASLDGAVSMIADERLREALKRLGTALRQDER